MAGWGKKMIGPRSFLVEKCLPLRHERAKTDVCVCRPGLSASEADEVVARLRAERFLDDERYARAFVHDKLAFNRWGRLRLRRELRAKRIAAEAIDAALVAIDEVAYRDTLLALLRAKLPQGGDTSPQARARLLRNAMAHGFETSLVIDCLRQLALDTHDLEPLIDDGAEGLD